MRLFEFPATFVQIQLASQLHVQLALSTSRYLALLHAAMSGKAKSVRKMLPVIPAGVEPAVSPRIVRSGPIQTSLSHSPLDLLLDTTMTSSLSRPRTHPGKSSKEGEDSSVTVAVRVRPLNKR